MEQTLDFNRFFDAYKSCVLNKQVDQLLDLYDQDLIAFDMWGRWSYADANSWRDTINNGSARLAPSRLSSNSTISILSMAPRWPPRMRQ